MKFTENFNLNLPDLDDMADVEKLNENFQTIDTKMKSLETDPELAANVVDIKNKIGEESDDDTQPTLFGRIAKVLNNVLGIDTKIGETTDSTATTKSGSLMGKTNVILKNVGRVKDINDNTYAAVMQGSPAPLKTVLSSSTGIVTLPYNVCQDTNYYYYMQPSGDTKIYKCKKSDLSVVASGSSTIDGVTPEGIADIDDKYIWCCRTGAIFKFDKTNLQPIKKFSISDKNNTFGGTVNKLLSDGAYLYTIGATTMLNKLSMDTVEYIDGNFIDLVGDYLCIDDKYAYAYAGLTIYRMDKTSLNNTKEVLGTMEQGTAIGMASDGQYLYALSVQSGATKIAKIDVNTKQKVLTGSVQIDIDTATTKRHVNKFSIDDSSIYLSAKDGKTYKINKNTLTISIGTQDSISGPVFVDNDYLYGIISSGNKVSQVKKTSDSIFTIESFKEV